MALIAAWRPSFWPGPLAAGLFQSEEVQRTIISSFLDALCNYPNSIFHLLISRNQNFVLDLWPITGP
jgi:hypothetical protein